MNRTALIGNIGQTAEIKTLDSGATVIKFSIAHTEKWTNKTGEKQSKTTWFDCNYWTEKTAIAQYLKQGTKIYVEGTVSARGWTDKSGAVQASLDLRIERIELLGQAQNSVTTEPATVSKPNEDFLEEDDLPF
jgi:single-strand DNA-binding protein